MWYPLLAFRKADPSLAESAADLLRSTAASLIVTTIGIFGACLFIAWIKPPSDVDIRTIPLAVLAIVVCLIALAMLLRRLLAAPSRPASGLRPRRCSPVRPSSIASSSRRPRAPSARTR